MSGKTFHYEELTATELAELDRGRTLALMAIGPLEVHGLHLPLGTDVLVAIELQRRIVARVLERWPETDFLILPPLYAAADALPATGSVQVNSRTVHGLLLDIGRGLADQGFRTLLLTDNHAGPRHQIAVEKAVRRLYRRHGFALVAPFQRFYRRMAEDDARLLEETGTSPGSSGDDLDLHAGTNETSLVLVFAPGMILPVWKTLPRTAVPETEPAKRLLDLISGVVGGLGARRLGRDLAHLGTLLGWTGMASMPTYIGDPSQASADAGERMLEAHVAEAMAMLEEVWSGQAPFSEPMLWDLRFVEGSR
jgi:creatinine amidohydrolase/Fe(II)-dependent formamide hydrolase-like protein